jgi:hypothetical protein
MGGIIELSKCLRQRGENKKSLYVHGCSATSLQKETTHIYRASHVVMLFPSERKSLATTQRRHTSFHKVATPLDIPPFSPFHVIVTTIPLPKALFPLISLFVSCVSSLSLSVRNITDNIAASCVTPINRPITYCSFYQL